MIEKTIKTVATRLAVQGLDSYEVVGQETNSLIIEAASQLVHLTSRSAGRGVAIRAIKGGQVGFASTTDISQNALGRLVEDALASMRYTSESDNTAVAKKTKDKLIFCESISRPPDGVPVEEKIKVALEIESEAIAADSRVVKIKSPRYEEHSRNINIVNSNGAFVSASRSMIILRLKAVARNDGESQGAYEFAFSNDFDTLDVKKLAREAAMNAVAKLFARPAAPGRYMAILSPKAAAGMVKMTAPSFFASNVQRGKSAIALKLKERIYSPTVSIIDDGVLPGGYASFAFDGEGVSKGRTALVLEGVVTGWLYDSGHALKSGVHSTGNSVRESINKMPCVGVNNCFMKAGETGSNELAGSVKKGILVTDLQGAHTANTISGDFSVGVEGFLIKGGRTTDPVRGMTMAGNVHELLGTVAAVCSDLRFFGAYGAPTVLVEGVTFGA